MTCSGFSLEHYLNLGKRQSEIQSNASRDDFYRSIFIKYCDYLRENQLFDPAFETQSQAEPYYNLIVVDEAQNFSLLALRQLERISHDHAIVYCMDSQQNLYSHRNVRDLLVQSFRHDGITLGFVLLNTTHRYTQNVARALDNIKYMARTIQGGSLDKQEAPLMCVTDTGPGTFMCIDE